MNKKDFMVRVHCLTYNQAPYIEETMNGFVLQKTDFPFVCTIFDDNSTDGEPDVINNYLEKYFALDDVDARQEDTDDYKLVYAHHKDNANCYFAVYFLKYNHYSIGKARTYADNWIERKYIAVCEGDDFWIVNDKLQKQVDFLEKNPEYVLTYTNTIVVDKDSKVISKLTHKRYSGNCTQTLITEGNYLITAGVCYRNGYEKEINDVIASLPFKGMIGDKILWIILSTKGLFCYFDEYMIAYRRLEESASHTKDYDKSIRYSDNVKDINLYFNKLYNVGISENRIIQDARLHRLLSAPILNWTGFSTEFLKAVVDYPHFLLRKRYWKTLARSLKSKIYSVQ